MELTTKVENPDTENNSDSFQIGLKAALTRIYTDWLSMPVFIVWSAIISTMIELSSDEKTNDFFVSVLGEGIALKSIATLFVIALLPAGVALLRPPKQEGNWIKILSAPTKLGRGMSMTTLAFMLGVIPAYWYSEGFFSAISGLTLPISFVAIMWLILFVGDYLIVNARELRSGSDDTLFKILGCALIITWLTACGLLYWQITSGAYFAKL